MVAASASRLDRAASKGTSWAAGSCSHATSARTAQVSVASCHVNVAPCDTANYPPMFFFFVCLILSDEADDWDFDASPKPNEVQNDMYVRDEEEEEDEEAEEEADDSDARKVVVRWRQ